MKCQNCLTEIDSDEARYIDDVPYCESCFFDSYNYCSVCDVVLHREDIRYDDNGDPFCEDCYHSETDEDCPNNPEVFDCDRETVLCLARNWLKGIKPKCFIKVNRN
ncbi:MAG: hypothetical protein U5K00_00550 [Melioribacteraceae bacterium]|nr:hypothetical protein [Melioribacteraceae bacterium]